MSTTLPGANFASATICASTAVWAHATGQPGWLTVLLVVLAVANLAVAGLILRGEARR